MRHTNETKRKVERFRDLKRVVKGGGEQEISHVSSLTERERVCVEKEEFVSPMRVVFMYVWQHV